MDDRSFENQCNVLQKALEFEYKLGLVEKVVKHADDSKEKMLMLIEIAVLCIMHAENRTGEKII